MAEKECLFAFTELTGKPYPGFVNISEVTSTDEAGMVDILVRSPGHNGDKMASLRVDKETIQIMAETLVKQLGPRFNP